MDTAGEGLLMVIAVSGAGTAAGALGAGLAALAAAAGGAAVAALGGAAGRAAGPARAAGDTSHCFSATNQSRIFMAASPVTARLHGHGHTVQRGAVVPEDLALVLVRDRQPQECLAGLGEARVDVRVVRRVDDVVAAHVVHDALHRLLVGVHGDVALPFEVLARAQLEV